MKKRDVAVSIVLTIVTCGLYGIYWFICLTDDVKEASKDKDFPSGVLSFILSFITCGIYSIYWAYKMGELLKNAQKKRKTSGNDNSILYLVLQLFGLGIINYALIQNELNELGAE